MSSPIVEKDMIRQKILLIRGHKVMLDRDLAALYGVSTKALNQAVKRNFDRFPKDFMFRLTETEKREAVTVCDHLKPLKFSPVLPHAFTEHGALMAANVLNSSRAIQMSIFIVRTFIQLRRTLSSQKDIVRRLFELERQGRYSDEIRMILRAILKLMTPPPEPDKPRRRIGFHSA